MKKLWLLAMLIAPLAFAGPKVRMETNHGNIVVELAPKAAPQTVKNFLRYVDSKRMDGFSFYRSTKSWGPASQLIQAGNRGDGRKNYPQIAHEPTNVTGILHKRGAISMARWISRSLRS